jgi:hypothetical protein
MERLTSFPGGALATSALSTAIAIIAIFVFGAPAWTLLPITLLGGTLHAELCSRAERRHEHKG